MNERELQADSFPLMPAAPHERPWVFGILIAPVAVSYTHLSLGAQWF